MTAYITNLEKALRDDLTVREEASSRMNQERLRPLEERIARLLRNVPIENQVAGLPIAFFQASLRGRQRPSAQTGEIGTALRRLGFERRRSWKKGGGFSALWHRAA
jgi:hypothetical protein